MARISFDVNGTLLDPGPGFDALALAVQMSMVDTLLGRFRPFRELIRAAGGEPPETMPAFSDVGAGLARLIDSGHELIALTNSARETAHGHLTAAGLLGCFAEVRGADEAQAYKPDPRVYALVDSDWHVAAHWWDIFGAAAAGRRTVYLQRRAPLPPGVQADVVVQGLDELDPAWLA